MEPREKYNQQKRQVYDYVRALCGDSITQLALALQAAETSDKKLIAEVEARGKELRNLEERIDTLSAHIIALEQPVASDLRSFITYIKIVIDFERISTHAVSLATASQRMSHEFLKVFLPEIRALVQDGNAMLGLAMDALETREVERLSSIPEMDERIDKRYKALTKEVTSLMKRDQSTIEDGVVMLMLLRFLERLGDHVTNIAEWVYYARTGKHIEFND